jgi:uncharacterized protein (DUF305 family)
MATDRTRRLSSLEGARVKQTHENHYPHLGIMALLSFVAMYVLMYAMVNTFGDAYNNVNQVYMAGLMAAPMVVIELVVMRGMYHDSKLNLTIISASVVTGILLFAAIRQQTVVTDSQFLRSMIPHHSGAILMCREADLRADEIRRLCEAIISSQQREIDQMNAILRRIQ